ncbi:MAG: insulinase family protein [Candidatus Harrisonbacteria bacterium]|nr:insulinase family protein [Candidatus Harrisonbacteria bacterium]
MNFIKKITKSGVPLYILPMPSANTVASGVLVNVGSRDEKMPEEAGLAHGFEHMFCQGSKKFPNKKSLFEYIEEIGGVRNAFTWKEITFFHNQVPFNEFERGVDLLSEQIQYSLIQEEKVSKEMKVVMQELKRRQDSPAIFLGDLTFEAVFGDHPIGHMTLGNEQTLLRFNRESFISFLNRYYNSSNYTFLVAGNVDPDLALDTFNKYFVLKAGEKNIRPRLSIQPAKKTAVFYKGINQAHINLAIPIDVNSLKEKWSLNLFAMMIGYGSSSPLYIEIRDKRGLCYSVNANYYWGTDYGLFKIYMATDKEKYKEAIDLAFSVLTENKNNATLLEKAKKMELGALARRFENPINIISDAAESVAFTGSPYGFQEVGKAIKDITIQNIEKVVDKYLKPEQFTAVLLAPEDFKE